MTAPETAAVPLTPIARPSLSIATVVSFAGGVGLLILHSFVRVLGANSFGDEEASDTVALVLGILGLATLLPILVNIVLAHIGILASQRGRKSGRTLAVAAATIGYVLLALYVNRLVVVVVALAAQGNGIDQFVQNFYWWS